MGVGLKGNEGLCGCRGCCFVSFPSLAEAPRSLCSESKATLPDKGQRWRENGSGLAWSLGYWNSGAFSCDFDPHLVCLPVCLWSLLVSTSLSLLLAKFAIWYCRCAISPYELRSRVCSRGTSPGSSCIYVRVCVCVSDPRSAVSPQCASGLSLLDAGINKQALICNILTWQQNKKARQSTRGPRRQPATHPPSRRAGWIKLAREAERQACTGCFHYFGPKLSLHVSGRWKQWFLRIMFDEPAGLKTTFVLPESLFSASCLPK